jgi:hypothetical protein
MNRNADQLTLHEAMAVVLRGRGWVERDTVARELAERELYLRPKDGQPPPSWQLGMRVRKYRDWFEARGPSGAQIRLVPGGPGEAVDSPVPARTTRRRSSPGSSGQISASASPTSADTKKAREQRARAARKYKPANIKTLLVAEAPPSSTERYFYFEHVRTHDSLFRHVANAILGQTPTRNEKANALAQLRERGVFLIDLCADPVDGGPLSTHVPALIRRVRKLAPAKVILIKATVYDNAFAALRDANLPVVDERVPFPGSGQQRRFAAAFERALRG